MRRQLAAIGLALSLTACASLGGPHMAAAKSLADGWAALDGAALGADAAVKAGLLKGPTAKTVAEDLRLAQVSLQAASDAYRTGKDRDAVSQAVIAASAVSAVLVAVAQAQEHNQ